MKTMEHPRIIIFTFIMLQVGLQESLNPEDVSINSLNSQIKKIEEMNVESRGRLLLADLDEGPTFGGDDPGKNKKEKRADKDNRTHLKNTSVYENGQNGVW